MSAIMATPDAREESALIDALRTARADATAAQSPAESSLAKGVLTTRRLRAVWHVLALLRGAFARGARREKLKLFTRTLDAVIDSWYDEDRLAALTDLEVHLAEERAEGAQDLAEIEFFARPCAATALKLIETGEAHIAGTRRLMTLAAREIAPRRGVA